MQWTGPKRSSDPPPMISRFTSAGADEQVGIEAGDALGNREVALVLPDQFVRDRDHVTGNGKAAQRDMRASGMLPTTWAAVLILPATIEA